LTHSDITGELFLSGCVYDYESINQQMRDEVITEWKRDRYVRYFLSGEAYVDDGEFSKEVSEVRLTSSKRKWQECFMEIDSLLPTIPSYIQFHSIYPEYKQTFYLH
jgi:hypothetical protein